MQASASSPDSPGRRSILKRTDVTLSDRIQWEAKSNDLAAAVLTAASNNLAAAPISERSPTRKQVTIPDNPVTSTMEFQRSEQEPLALQRALDARQAELEREEAALQAQTALAGALVTLMAEQQQRQPTTDPRPALAVDAHDGRASHVNSNRAARSRGGSTLAPRPKASGAPFGQRAAAAPATRAQRSPSPRIRAGRGKSPPRPAGSERAAALRAAHSTGRPTSGSRMLAGTSASQGDRGGSTLYNTTASASARRREPIGATALRSSVISQHAASRTSAAAAIDDDAAATIGSGGRITRGMGALLLQELLDGAIGAESKDSHAAGFPVSPRVTAAETGFRAASTAAISSSNAAPLTKQPAYEHCGSTVSAAPSAAAALEGRLPTVAELLQQTGSDASALSLITSSATAPLSNTAFDSRRRGPFGIVGGDADVTNAAPRSPLHESLQSFQGVHQHSVAAAEVRAPLPYKPTAAVSAALLKLDAVDRDLQQMGQPQREGQLLQRQFEATSHPTSYSSSGQHAHAAGPIQQSDHARNLEPMQSTVPSASSDERARYASEAADRSHSNSSSNLPFTHTLPFCGTAATFQKGSPYDVSTTLKGAAVRNTVNLGNASQPYRTGMLSNGRLLTAQEAIDSDPLLALSSSLRWIRRSIADVAVTSDTASVVTAASTAADAAAARFKSGTAASSASSSSGADAPDRALLSKFASMTYEHKEALPFDWMANSSGLSRGISSGNGEIAGKNNNNSTPSPSSAERRSDGDVTYSPAATQALGDGAPWAASARNTIRSAALAMASRSAEAVARRSAAAGNITTAGAAATVTGEPLQRPYLSPLAQAVSHQHLSASSSSSAVHSGHARSRGAGSDAPDAQTAPSGGFDPIASIAALAAGTRGTASGGAGAGSGAIEKREGAWTVTPDPIASYLFMRIPSRKEPSTEASASAAAAVQRLSSEKRRPADFDAGQTPQQPSPTRSGRHGLQPSPSTQGDVPPVSPAAGAPPRSAVKVIIR